MQYSDLSELIVKEGEVELAETDHPDGLIDMLSKRLMNTHNFLDYNMIQEFLVDMIEINSILITTEKKLMNGSCNQILLIHKNE